MMAMIWHGGGAAVNQSREFISPGRLEDEKSCDSCGVECRR